MLKPGTRIRFKNGCAWPERIGCEGVVVDPLVFGGFYPADKRIRWGTSDVIVKLDDDPLKATRFSDERWDCVTSVSSLEAVPVDPRSGDA